MTSHLINDSNYHNEEENYMMNIEIQNRGIFTNTQLFQFVIDQNGNKITLGEGSFGFVMLIRNVKTNQLYALKLIPISSIETITHKKIIEREVRVHPELYHPYIIKMHDAFINKDAIYIILDYAVNKTVQETFLQRFTYDEDRAFKYFYQTCLAIDYLHRRGIMHRDIKPENLLLDENDNIKICDFGWCAEITKTRRTTLCGTFEYMAPETIMQKEYDYRIDIWQLGILLYELLHGRTPFKPQIELDEDDRMDYFKNLINQGHVVFDDHISPAAIDLMSSILIYVPEKRISLQGILAHVWIFQMKAKTSYKENPEILSQIQQTEQNIIAIKQNQEQQLIQTQKIMNSQSNQPSVRRQQQSVNSLAPVKLNFNNNNNLFTSNNNSNQIGNEIFPSPTEERQGSQLALPDWSSNINANAPIEKKNAIRKNSIVGENKDVSSAVLVAGGGSQIKQNIDKGDYQKNPIYERELARMMADDERETIILDLQDLPFKQEQKIAEQKQFFYVPSYVQRRDFQSQINVRANATGKLSVFKLSTQFDISNYPTSNRRAIFGDFDKEKKNRQMQELDNIVEQINMDKASKQIMEQKGNETKNKQNLNIVYNDNLSEMSQVSSVKYGSIFQTKKF